MNSSALLALLLAATSALSLAIPPKGMQAPAVIPMAPQDAKGFLKKHDKDVSPVGHKEAKKLWDGLEKDQKGGKAQPVAQVQAGVQAGQR
ncbi:hypothetical protein BCR33DRAFT_710982 [Rhizoclosmatium globosum]|uniref:Uncharacterized protein n=1 Tax=Rhizoclosmatium globosum TaxID=329046 RepID=A0A1Y2D2Z5_9FUNG|nr:hypothetical protein BCR33DRAFT_710982 [Rhizoclosmatium globosum]|eukprot:ORY53587.1 hypothetical protein BCR33DRAFT_710982 [Rhizoclosmatium globosum]